MARGKVTAGVATVGDWEIELLFEGVIVVTAAFRGL